jgi:iron complex transport system ATP-binding protein
MLARALTQEPRVLLLDEATAHLDLKHQLAVLKLVRALARQKKLAVLATLHDLNQASLFADRIVLLAAGRLRAEGTPAQVLTKDQLGSVYGVPVHIVEHPARGTPLVLPDVEAEE